MKLANLFFFTNMLHETAFFVQRILGRKEGDSYEVCILTLKMVYSEMSRHSSRDGEVYPRDSQPPVP